MIHGVVNSDGVPEIAISVAGREWPAIVDTGFNGDLELPASLLQHVNAQYTMDIVSLLAGGQQIIEPAYDVEFPFDGFDVSAEATFVGDSEILLGTGLLRDYRLEVDFAARTVMLERLRNR